MVYPQVVTHQLQVERRTAKGRRSKTDILPLDHATNLSVTRRQKWYDANCLVWSETRFHVQLLHATRCNSCMQ